MKSKKLLSIALCAAMGACVGLSACGDGDKGGDDTEPVKLAAPEISLDGAKISWSAVENATGYEVYEGENKVATQTETSYSIMQTAVGSYVYTVYATSTDTAKFSRSAASNTVTYTVKVADVSVPLAADKKIYVVGDSTVCDYSAKPDNYYLQRFGYGTQLFNYLNLSSPTQVVNLALSGRSSLSFLKEANYNTLKTSIGAGDYLIIGFGHNDEKSDDKDRFTDPEADYTVPSTAKAPSFQYTLYENYVKLAKDKGATPILCTPIVRYADDGVYEGKSVSHVTADGDYAAAINKLGADTDTAVVDLTKITKEYYSAHNADAKFFHAYTTYTGADKTPDGKDNTHINQYGAKQIAYWLLNNLPEGCPLKAHVNDTQAPAKDVDYAAAINKNYVKPDYAGFDPADHENNKLTSVATGNTVWFKTAMGVLGGQSKVANHKVSYENGKFIIDASTGTGSKFSDTQDGFAAAFVQIDESKNFTATAKAKVTGAPASVNNQNAFGIMLRDDIVIDTEDKTLVSNFVSASVTGGGKANMSRTEKAKLDYDGKIAFKDNAEYELTLTRVGQVVEATIKNGANEVRTTFTDISFVGVDNTKMYLCLFANRGLKVEFTDVSFAITGEAQGA